MKKILILLLFIISTVGINAQTFEEWFRQKETQKKYLLQQIAAFQAYLGYINKGYSIVQKGITTISDIKKGEFNLHTDYFSSLKRVNPRIKNYTKVAAIMAVQYKIMQVYNRAYKKIRESKAFNNSEISYIYGVFGSLLDDCSGSIDELITIITSNKKGMKDDERLKRIDTLYKDMQDQYTFAESFGNESMALAAAKTQEKKDIQTIRRIYNIK